jgi:hypothetical protein
MQEFNQNVCENLSLYLTGNNACSLQRIQLFLYTEIGGVRYKNDRNQKVVKLGEKNVPICNVKVGKPLYKSRVLQKVLNIYLNPQNNKQIYVIKLKYFVIIFSFLLTLLNTSITRTGTLLFLGTASKPIRTQVRGFKPGRSPSDFSGRKKKFSARLPFGGEVKAVLSHVADLPHVKEP